MTWSVTLPAGPKSALADQYASRADQVSAAAAEDDRAAVAAQFEASRALVASLVDGLADDASVSVSAGGYRSATASSVSVTVSGELEKRPGPRRRG